MTAPDREPAGDSPEDHVLCVRAGHGANCSSIGSVVDTLFATAAVGAAVFAAVAAAMQREDVRVVTPRAPDATDAAGGEPRAPEGPEDPP